MRVVIFSFIVFISLSQGGFLAQQSTYERVRAAIDEKQVVIDEMLKKEGLEKDNFNLLFMAFKEEKKLMLFAKKKGEGRYKELFRYDVCRSSGVLGPKRKEGDLQVPEGFYHIDRFNPVSTYYLSLGINYPNQADKKKSTHARLGGDIFIHGECVTIGCLPMTNDKIKEIYLLAIHAHNNGQSRIPVYIFPFEMTDINMKKHTEHPDFWKNLKNGYDTFFANPKELTIKVLANGDYGF